MNLVTEDSKKITIHDFVEYAKCIGLHGVDLLEKLLDEKAFTVKDLDIDGSVLIKELNMKPGPKIKSILNMLHNEVIEHPENNEKQKLLELAKKFESLATRSLNTLLNKTAAGEWWRLSDQEEQGQLDKEYDFGKGLKFKAKDIPELATQIEVPAGPVEHHPEKNQLMHTNLVYDRAKKISEDPMVWFAALLHDLGKSHTDKAIWPKQYGHEEGGVPYVEQVSNLLGVPEDWKDFAMQVARHHLNCHRAAELSPKTLKKLFEAFKNDRGRFNSFMTACQADAQGRLGLEDEPYPQTDILGKKWDEIAEEKKAPKFELAISGADLQKELGLKPGPDLGKILKQVKEMAEKNPNMNNKQYLLDYAKTLLVK